MSWLLLLLMAQLIYFSFAKYRKILSAALAIAAVFLPLIAAAYYGFYVYGDIPYVEFIGDRIPKSAFYHLLAGWFGADILCSFFIVRNLLAWRRVNIPPDR